MGYTLNQMFTESVIKFSDNPAIFHKVHGKYMAIKYRQLGEKVRTLASGLVALGVQKGDRIALISENRPEWAIADISLMQIGAINVAIFPTLPTSQVQYIVADSGSKIILISDKNQLAKALELKKALPRLLIVTMDCDADTTNGVMTFDEVLKRGEAYPLNDLEYEQHWRSVKPSDWASIVYTSGTTGSPRGAILSHHNFASNVEAAREVMNFHPGDVLLSFAPLNHVMGRLIDHYVPLNCGAAIAYVESLRQLRQNMIEVKPHFMLLVPRVFEIFQEGLLRNIAKQSSLKQKFLHWALSIGQRRSSKCFRERRDISLIFKFQWWLANKIALNKIRGQMGLQRLRFFFSGGAPLSIATAQFFHTMGLVILEGYGLTETSPLVSANRPEWFKFGTVGQPVKGVEVKIADDGEILVRGPNVLQGYYNKPKETSEAIDADGWFHTGDIGKFDEDNFLTITGRKKELLVLANGKKVAPQPIENRMKESAYITQIILLGDKENTISALIVPSFERIKDWAKECCIDFSYEDNSELVHHPEVNSLIRREIQRLSGDLADFEKIHLFTLIDQEFTIERGEMTPTLKIKRHVLVEKYKDVIEAMYRG